MSKTPAKGQAFFDESGKGITPALKAMLQLLGQVEDSRVATERAARLLAAAQVLVPFSFKTRPSGPAQDLAALGELYMVDQARLNALDNEGFIALRQHDALALAYAQITSVHHLDALIRFSDALRQAGAAGKPQRTHRTARWAGCSPATR
ncbi:MAG: SapC family protein [Comamonadaceae bacterium]|nr:SapC family protein [Comamonadaceae bacterium]